MAVFSEPNAELAVYIDGQRSRSAQVMTINVSCGGRSMDSAIVSLAPTSPIANVSIVPDVQTVEIVHVNAPGANAVNEQVLVWGKTSGVRASLASAFFEVSAAPFLFGDCVRGMPEYDPRSRTLVTLKDSIVFNPTVSGLVRGNMAGAPPFATPYAYGRHNVFLDPRRTHTEAARRYATGQGERGGGASHPWLLSDNYWTLKEAVYFLCWHLNPRETNYRNPSREELADLDLPSASFHDVRVPLGDFLPEALDKVLSPFARTWCVDYVGRNNRKLKFMRRCVGPRKTLKLQPTGQDLNPAKTNLADLQIGCGLQSLINQVVVYGGRKLWEGTFELSRAWAAEHDELTEYDLSLESEDYLSNPEYHRVWRDWVLNEGGDYIGLRDANAPYDLSSFFGRPTVARRRAFQPCVTIDKDRLPVGRHGYVIEWSDDGGETWYPLEELEDASVEILQDECGIRFTGINPPAQLLYSGSSARVRITCGIYDDDRVTHDTGRTGLSCQPGAAVQLIDSDRFQFRKVHKSSTLNGNGGYQTSAVDDSGRALTYAEDGRVAWDKADISGTAVLPSLRINAYRLGDVITKIEGREIALSAHDETRQEFPQVVGIQYDVQRQRQLLALETFRNTNYVL